MTKGHDVEVRPCPFCGKIPEFWNESHGGRVYSMQCECGCELGWEMREEDILERWNRRVAT